MKKLLDMILEKISEVLKPRILVPVKIRRPHSAK